MKVIIVGLTMFHLCGCAALAVGAAAGAAGGAVTSARQEGYSAPAYVATVLANAVYLPVKVIVAAGGAVTSGAAYIVTGGRRNVSSRIWRRTVEGDYVLTPAQVTGREPIHFAG